MRPPSRSPHYNRMIQGPDPNAFQKLKNLVVTLQQRYFYYMKVGITNNPEIRWKQHKLQDPRWEDFVVAYKTNDRNEVKSLEKKITKIYNIENIRMGGGGPNSTGTQYLYFLATKSYNLGFKRTSRYRYGYYK